MMFAFNNMQTLNKNFEVLWFGTKRTVSESWPGSERELFNAVIKYQLIWQDTKDHSQICDRWQSPDSFDIPIERIVKFKFSHTGVRQTVDGAIWHHRPHILINTIIYKPNLAIAHLSVSLSLGLVLALGRIENGSRPWMWAAYLNLSTCTTMTTNTGIMLNFRCSIAFRTQVQSHSYSFSGSLNLSMT